MANSTKLDGPPPPALPQDRRRDPDFIEIGSRRDNLAVEQLDVPKRKLGISPA